MSTLTQNAFIGALDPYALRYVVTSTSASFDLSTIVSASFHIQRSDGTTATWSATMSNASATSLTLLHLYQSGDLPIAETIKAVPHLVLPASAGVIICDAATIIVRPEYF